MSKQKPIIGYHFLREDFSAGSGDEKPWKIGETRTIADRSKIALCKYGYHFSPTLWDALPYAPGPLACKVEVIDVVAEDGDENQRKGVAVSRKLIAAVNIDRELRLFAADCAERALYIFERDYPNDKRPREAIQAARDFANGKIGAAAWDAAQDAAWAAGAAAWAAARAAAGNAARAAAWDAAGAAGNAAWAAAGAARAAAWAAAGAAAEIKWQRDHFNSIFGGIFGEVTK